MLGRLLLYGFIAVLVLPLVVNVYFYFVEKELEENPVSQIKSQRVSFESAKALYEARCANCHGINGDGAGGMARVNGEKEHQIAQKLIGYKNKSYGSSAKGVMELQVQDLTIEELQEIAKYLSSLKPIMDEEEKIKKRDLIDLDHFDISS
ncbi:MAG: cytochrome c [Campylobacterota bacterium]|nr:cytochrome c [Campylobacterota bacterium]